MRSNIRLRMGMCFLVWRRLGIRHASFAGTLGLVSLPKTYLTSLSVFIGLRNPAHVVIALVLVWDFQSRNGSLNTTVGESKWLQKRDRARPSRSGCRWRSLKSY